MAKVSEFMACSNPGEITSWEHAHTVLRMHPNCSGHTCDTRHAALAYIDRIVCPAPEEGGE